MTSQEDRYLHLLRRLLNGFVVRERQGSTLENVHEYAEALQWALEQLDPDKTPLKNQIPDDTWRVEPT